jgi:hypothetical protein
MLIEELSAKARAEELNREEKDLYRKIRKALQYLETNIEFKNSQFSTCPHLACLIKAMQFFNSTLATCVSLYSPFYLLPCHRKKRSPPRQRSLSLILMFSCTIRSV